MIRPGRGRDGAGQSYCRGFTGGRPRRLSCYRPGGALAGLGRCGRLSKHRGFGADAHASAVQFNCRNGRAPDPSRKTFLNECRVVDIAGVAVAWDGAPLMRFLNSFRATEVAEDPDVVARRDGIAARSRAETSLYQAVEKAQRPQGAPRPFRRARKVSL